MSYSIKQTKNYFYVADHTGEPVSDREHVLRQDAVLEAVAYYTEELFECVESGETKTLFYTVEELDRFLDDNTDHIF